MGGGFVIHFNSPFYFAILFANILERNFSIILELNLSCYESRIKYLDSRNNDILCINFGFV